MKKILGWIILTIGIASIVWGLWASIDIFTAQRPVYEVFKYQPDQDNGQASDSIQGVPTEEDVGRLIKEQIEAMLPPTVIFKFFNLAAWGIFMMILILSGGKLAGIGISLLREEQ